MIFYSWIARSESDLTAGRERDLTAGRERDLTALSESDLMALSESDLMALSESDLMALSESGSTVPDGGCSGTAESPVAMGITDDRGRAMKAGEETLRSGRAAVVIIEAVRPALAAHTLARCYVRTGAAWLGRCTEAGEVTWNRFFLPADPDDQQGPGRIEP
jgi:hypothetical protein